MDSILSAGIASSLATALGALPAMLLSNVTHRARDVLLAFTAGIMVAASTYGLIPSALKISNLLVLCCGILLGTVVLTMLEKFLPHIEMDHAHSTSSLDPASMMFVTAMTLHNLPEGLSVGVSFASHYENLGNLVAFVIGLQNVPEGFLTALFLITRGVGRGKALVYAIFTGVIELGSCLLGYQFTSRLSFLVPYGLAFAAGAMLFVVYKELIPESHGDGHERPATFSFIMGLLTMICLTDWLK